MAQLRPYRLLSLAAALLLPVTLPIAAQTQPQSERKVVTKVDPIYPLLAKRTSVRGVVKLEVAVKPNGSVKSVKVVGGNPVLLDAATEAVRNWKFEPAADETTELVRVVFEPR